jgi:hypothetical protein
MFEGERMLKKNILWSFMICSYLLGGSAHAFDLEDYATKYREKRDAYLKASNELKLATGPYKAARDARIANEKMVATANENAVALVEAVRKESAAAACGL